MPVRQVEQKVVDPENELNNVQRNFQRLAPLCSVAKRALGMPQLKPQEKQLGILAGEMQETVLCISMATKGRHALLDGQVKKYMRTALDETVELAGDLRDQTAQLKEVNCLNYLLQKNMLELTKQVLTEADELANIENALNRLKQIENRLEIATKRFCVVNYDNSQIRHEINRLLVERNGFNLQWNRTIAKLLKGKMFLLDIFEVAGKAFADREEFCLKLEALKWKGVYGLNRDITEMQLFQCELNHLSKLEEFLRVKGSRRVCEADEIEQRKREEERERCQREIERLDELLNEIFAYSQLDTVRQISREFRSVEIMNFSIFQLICKVLQESIMTRRLITKLHATIFYQRDLNGARADREKERLAAMREELVQTKATTQMAREADAAANAKIVTTLKAIEELTRLANCDTSPLKTLLGPHAVVTKYNVGKFSLILEQQAKMLIQVAYGEVAPPVPTKGPRKASAAAKLVADPYVETLRPNSLAKLVDYLPCAYCVEDYILNLVYESPAEVATEQYVQEVFHLEDPNTKWGIYTLTIPAKRHPYRGPK